MSMRDQIAEILRKYCHEGHNGRRLGVAADAILEALPDMIAPLVWEYDAGWHNAGHYEIQGSSFEEDVMLSYRESYCRTVFKNVAEAQAAANIHHRATIMAAFTGETQ